MLEACSRGLGKLAGGKSTFVAKEGSPLRFHCWNLFLWRSGPLWERFLGHGGQSNQEAKGPGALPLCCLLKKTCWTGACGSKVAYVEDWKLPQKHSKVLSFCVSLPRAPSSRATPWPASERDGSLCFVCNLLGTGCVLGPLWERLFRTTLQNHPSRSVETCRMRKGSC